MKSNLNANHPLFKELEKNPPQWWETLKSHPMLYIEIRKDNYINVYYQGGSIAKIHYNEASKSILAEAHPKYLGKIVKNKKNITYLDCTDWLTNNLEQLLLNVETNYSNKNDKDSNPEDRSEKKIQGEIIINNRHIYLDSEFQHLVFHRKNDDGQFENKFIRIDLIKVVDDTLVFVELKHIRDNRLLNKDIDSEPEIIAQIRSYAEFIEFNSEELIDYYTNLYRIKDSLRLPVPRISNINKLSINLTPELLIKNTYTKSNNARKGRIAKIEEVLQRNGINYRIE